MARNYQRKGYTEKQQKIAAVIKGLASGNCGTNPRDAFPSGGSPVDGWLDFAMASEHEHTRYVILNCEPNSLGPPGPIFVKEHMAHCSYGPWIKVNAHWTSRSKSKGFSG